MSDTNDDDIIIEDNNADILREQIEQRKGPSDKTVIVFEYTYDDVTVKKRRRTYYTFVAIWIEQQGKWYCSGLGGGVPREPSHEELMKILASFRVKKASVAIDFDRFKP
jgi:hypothetical protein